MSDLPRRWWQWVLMYPAIFIALAAGGPQIYRSVVAITIGLSPFANVGEAQQQQKAWERNVGCLGGIQHIKPVSRTRYAIDVVPCPSGDILLTLSALQNPDQQVSRWIITEALFNEVAQSFFSTSALAQGAEGQRVGPTPVRVVDIKNQGSTVIRRVQLSDNTCVDETIDAYTGRRLSEQKAPCAPF